jgi:hypothetical protein
MKEINAKVWETPKHRKKLSEQFDLDCYKMARNFIVIQNRAIAAMLAGKAVPSYKEMNQLILSMKKAQEMGKCAFGEIIESTQMKLDLRVVYDDPKE